jgi:hypothetical protein
LPTDVQDLRSTIIPRSDQLNSEQLLGGPMIITVSDVRAGGGEDQPVSIFYEADPGRPYKPCKTMRKVLILAWGPDGTQWIGKSMELYCEPSVKFGGEVVGGIRISRLSDIPKEIKVSLTATKGRKSMHEIGLLKSSPALTAVPGCDHGGDRAREPAEGARAGRGADLGRRHRAGARRIREEGRRVEVARLAERLKKTEDRDIAALVLDEGRALPPDQQKELGALFFEKFGE